MNLIAVKDRAFGVFDHRAYVREIPCPKERTEYLLAVIECQTQVVHEEMMECLRWGMTLAQTRLFLRLKSGLGRTFTMEALVNSMYVASPDYGSPASMRVQLGQVRRILKARKLPYKITNVRDLGYRMDRIEACVPDRNH